MTTDERIEALTQSVELLSRMHQDNEQRNTQYFAVISQSLQKLTDIAENHEERVTKLETAMDKLATKFASRGGRARAAALTPQRRTVIARKAARARWGKPKPCAVHNAKARGIS